jgi:hypothetical protein
VIELIIHPRLFGASPEEVTESVSGSNDNDTDVVGETAGMNGLALGYHWNIRELIQRSRDGEIQETTNKVEPSKEEGIKQVRHVKAQAKQAYENDNVDVKQLLGVAGLVKRYAYSSRLPLCSRILRQIRNDDGIDGCVISIFPLPYIVVDSSLTTTIRYLLTCE